VRYILAIFFINISSSAKVFAGFDCKLILTSNTKEAPSYIALFQELGLEYTRELTPHPELEFLPQPEDLSVHERYKRQVLRILGGSLPIDLATGTNQILEARKDPELSDAGNRLNALPLLNAFYSLFYETKVSENHEASISIIKINPSIGYGVYSNEPLMPGDYIGEYTGVVKYDESADGIYTDYDMNYPVSLFNTLAIDASKHGNFTRFINHSFTPNVDFHYIVHKGVLKVIFVASEEIKKDEELFINYGEGYWNGREDFVPRGRNSIKSN